MVHHALHEPIECFQFDAGSDREGTAEQAAKRAKKGEGVAKPTLYRVTSKGAAGRLLNGCRE